MSRTVRILIFDADDFFFFWRILISLLFFNPLLQLKQTVNHHAERAGTLSKRRFVNRGFKAASQFQCRIHQMPLKGFQRVNIRRFCRW